MATKLKSQAINIDSIYPVGSIYISTVSTNPSNYFGGTWVAFGAGKTLVGIDSEDTDFDTAEETGGSKTHRHKHPSPVGYVSQTPYIFSNNEYADMIGDFNAGVSKTIQSRTRYAPGSSATGNTEVWNIYSSYESSLQPYITTYMWKRTA